MCFFILIISIFPALLKMVNKRNKRKVSSLNLTRCQKARIYHPTQRSRSRSLNRLESIKMNAAFASSEFYNWQKASNVIVINNHDQFRIEPNFHAKPRDTKGTRKYSFSFATIIDAENAAFEFRYNNESKIAKLNIDKHLIHLLVDQK